MRTRNKIIKEVIQCAETNGWHVDAKKHQDKNIVIFEFSQFTPAGQDFFFSATMQGRSPESLVNDMEEYYKVLMQIRKPVCGWTATDTAKTAHPTE